MSLLNRAARVSLVLVGLMAVATPAVATAASPRPAGAKMLSSDKVRQVGHVVCGRFFSARYWVPGTRLKKGYFITHERQAKNYAKLARKAKGKKRKKLNATAERYRRLAKGQRSRCYFPASPPASTGGWPGGWTPPPAAPATPLRFGMSGAVGLAVGDSVGLAPCVRRRRWPRQPRRRRPPRRRRGPTLSPSMDGPYARRRRLGVGRDQPFPDRAQRQGLRGVPEPRGPRERVANRAVESRRSLHDRSCRSPVGRAHVRRLPARIHQLVRPTGAATRRSSSTRRARSTTPVTRLPARRCCAAT